MNQTRLSYASSGIGISGHYELNMEKLDDLIKKIGNSQDPLAEKLHDAASGKKLKTQLAIEREALSKLSLPGVAEIDICKETAAICEKTIHNIMEILETFCGADPYTIQSIVHQILGISKIENHGCEFAISEVKNELNQQYFNLMIEMGFLKTSVSSLSEFTYNPGLIAKELLEVNSEIEKLVFGCGVLTKTYYTSCFWQAQQDHEKAILVDITDSLAPHIISCMHNLDLWKSIPDERLSNVHDHTQGYFLFDNEQTIHTLKEIYRTLKKEGCFESSLNLRPNDIEKLKEAGFTRFERKFAYKS